MYNTLTCDWCCISSWHWSTNDLIWDLGTIIRGEPSSFGMASNPSGYPSKDAMSSPSGGMCLYSLGNLLWLSWCPTHRLILSSGGIGCLGTLVYLMVPFSCSGATKLIPCSSVSLSPDTIVSPAGVWMELNPCASWNWLCDMALLSSDSCATCSWLCALLPTWWQERIPLPPGYNLSVLFLRV